MIVNLFGKDDEKESKIKVLRNPFISEPFYKKFKDYVLSEQLDWHYQQYDVSEDKSAMPHYTNTLLGRPENDIDFCRYPHPISRLVVDACTLIQKVLEFNQVRYNSFLRISVNCVHPQPKVISSESHRDHDFPHKNCIIYFTGAGGKTFVEDEKYDPKEDDAILFDGINHYMQSPLKERRIILVSTFV